MAYITGFSDNQLIGVDDLNAITKRLVTSGVGDILTDSGSIEVTELNGFTAAIATDGVVPESDLSLKVTKSESAITVATGLAFFADGSFIEITEAETLNFSGSDGYVYLINDVALGVREARAATDYPTGDFVLLAQISGGSVIDARKYAKGKLPSYSSYSGYPMYVEKRVICTGSTKYDRQGAFTVDLGGMPINGIAIKEDTSGATNHNCTGVCFFDEDKKVSLSLCKSAVYNKAFGGDMYQYYNTDVSFAKLTFSCTESGMLTVNVLSSSGLNSSTETTTEKIKFIIF